MLAVRQVPSAIEDGAAPSASSTRGSSPVTQAAPPPSQQPADSQRMSKVYAAGDVVDGRYVLIEQLGRGGMGVVWKARSTALDVEVAVKLVRSGASNPDSFKRMAREAHAAARLGHPAIATVLDFGATPEGAPYVVMELLRGESLGEVLNRERCVDVQRAVSTLLPIMDGLREAHDKGIVHRDIKPENLFLSKTSRGRLQPKVLDFGIAKLEQPMDSSTKLTQDGAVLGSPGYFSPEQARGQTDIDCRSDIWSISVVLYELITGELPFSGPNYNALLMAILRDTPKSITSLGHGDEELWRILQRGLHRDRDKRWASMWELGRALAAWLYGKGVRADVASRSLEEVWLEPRGASEAPAPGGFGIIEGTRRRVLSTLVKRRAADTLAGETVSNLIVQRVPARALGWVAASLGVGAIVWSVLVQGGAGPIAHAAPPTPGAELGAPPLTAPVMSDVSTSPLVEEKPTTPAPALPVPRAKGALENVRPSVEAVKKPGEPARVVSDQKEPGAPRAASVELAPAKARRLPPVAAPRPRPAKSPARKRIDQEFGF